MSLLSSSTLSVPHWLVSLRASIQLNQGLESARYSQLATIGNNRQQPACRTVVVREIYKDRALVITTDSRAGKVDQLHYQSICELCWFFPLTKEQYRIQGTAVVYDHNASDPEIQQLRQHLWENSLTPPARQQFELPAPGTHKLRVKPRDLDHYEAQPLSVEHPSDHFSLVLLFPHFIDYLFLPKPVISPHPIPIELAEGRGQDRTTEMQGRWQITRTDQKWNAVEVYP